MACRRTVGGRTRSSARLARCEATQTTRIFRATTLRRVRPPRRARGAQPAMQLARRCGAAAGREIIRMCPRQRQIFSGARAAEMLWQACPAAAAPAGRGRMLLSLSGCQMPFHITRNPRTQLQRHLALFSPKCSSVLKLQPAMRQQRSDTWWRHVATCPGSTFRTWQSGGGDLCAPGHCAEEQNDPSGGGRCVTLAAGCL